MTDNDVATLLMEVVPLVMSFIRTEMRHRRMPGLSIPQLRTLVFLYRNQDVMLSQVAERIGLKLPSTSKLVDSLVERKLVIRSVSPDDRRCNRLKLSPNGLAEMVRARRSTGVILVKKLATLTPEQQDRIATALLDLRPLFTAGRKEQ